MLFEYRLPRNKRPSPTSHTPFRWAQKQNRSGDPERLGCYIRDIPGQSTDSDLSTAVQRSDFAVFVQQTFLLKLSFGFLGRIALTHKPFSFSKDHLEVRFAHLIIPLPKVYPLTPSCQNENRQQAPF
jgi:hypothetical protein